MENGKRKQPHLNRGGAEFFALIAYTLISFGYYPCANRKASREYNNFDRIDYYWVKTFRNEFPQRKRNGQRHHNSYPNNPYKEHIFHFFGKTIFEYKGKYNNQIQNRNPW